MEGTKLPELWAGVECTTNRVGDRYHHQLDRLGHPGRLSDFDLFARLGIKALRQPVLWERVAPDNLNQDWRYPDAALARLRELHIRPIIGLVHHGSGPLHTSLLDRDFATKLSTYALFVASRYSWVEDYTPVNEPLTTARFSALYGHWYPHTRDDRSFVTALINQCRAVVLSMREVRRVNSCARLVQTDDFGKTYASPNVQYQADFENERRWIAWELVAGRVNHQHPLWNYLVRNGASDSELGWFEENSCPQDIIGINHYLSSDRYLDEEVSSYPLPVRGSNGRHDYADVLAARVLDKIPPRSERVREAWDRYHIPVALTEVHNGCTREEQLRWLHDLWAACVQLCETGADIRALTLWSLLGSYDWDTLVTQENGRYEPGVFDIRSPAPRRTAIAKLATNLAGQQQCLHPVLQAPGWWHRPERLTYGTCRNAEGEKRPNGFAPNEKDPQPLVMVGSQTALGNAFSHACRVRGIPYKLLPTREFDESHCESIRGAFTAWRPWAVVDASINIASKDDASSVVGRNDLPGLLATECARTGASLLVVSSDLVFDGTKLGTYVESDPVLPFGASGWRVHHAELDILNAYPSALIVRTGPLFGPDHVDGPLNSGLRMLASGQRLRIPHDRFTATYISDLVDTALDLLIDEECGVWHPTNSGLTSWFELVKTAADMMSLPLEAIELTSNYQTAFSSRPAELALASEKASIMPPLLSAIERYVERIRPELEAAVFV